MDEFTDHSKYIARHGLLRWILRECVRANPFYVISAMLILYGVTRLNSGADNEISKLSGVILTLSLLHAYELGLLAVATIVLKHRNGEGGCDLHGLSLVAALFLGGTLLALDELIALHPWTGWVFVPATLCLIYVKLWWYAQLPGMLLPLRYRNVMTLVLGAHCLSSLLGSPELSRDLGVTVIQGLAWLSGWLALLPVLWLVWYETRADVQPLIKDEAGKPRDLLQTRWCGASAVFVAAILGVLHLIGSDWVFLRPYEPVRLLPSLSILCACLILLRWARAQLDFFNALLALAPCAVACYVWKNQPSAPLVLNLPWLTGIQFQVAAAGVAIYAVLALATKRGEFLVGVFAPLWLPGAVWVWRNRGHALFSAALGFATLVLAMIVSLYRQRLLGKLDPQKPAAPQPTVVECPEAPTLGL